MGNRTQVGDDRTLYVVVVIGSGGGLGVVMQTTSLAVAQVRFSELVGEGKWPQLWTVRHTEMLVPDDMCSCGHARSDHYPAIVERSAWCVHKTRHHTGRVIPCVCGRFEAQVLERTGGGA